MQVASNKNRHAALASVSRVGRRHDSELDPLYNEERVPPRSRRAADEWPPSASAHHKWHNPSQGAARRRTSTTRPLAESQDQPALGLRGERRRRKNWLA